MGEKVRKEDVEICDECDGTKCTDPTYMCVIPIDSVVHRCANAYRGSMPEGRALQECALCRDPTRWCFEEKPRPESIYRSAAISIAKTVEEKQAAYGDSFGKAGSVMRILYPNGIAPEQTDDALVVVRVIDKLFRIATWKDAFGEDPWMDVMGYALLAVVKREEHGLARKKTE